MDGKGQTALHVATKYGHLPCVRSLLPQNPKLNVQDEDGLTPVHQATLHGFQEILSELLSSVHDKQEKQTYVYIIVVIVVIVV